MASHGATTEALIVEVLAMREDAQMNAVYRVSNALFVAVLLVGLCLLLIPGGKVYSTGALAFSVIGIGIQSARDARSVSGFLAAFVDAFPNGIKGLCFAARAIYTGRLSN